MSTHPSVRVSEAVEANFDGLVGPTHNYGGLSSGNQASKANAGAVSNPQAAVLEGIEKAARMARRGFAQGVLPPQERPHLGLLRAAGFSGSEADMVAAAAKADPVLLTNACASSAMWAANAATVSPSADTADGRVHLTPANLNAMLHRSIEAPDTQAALTAAFPAAERFVVHAPGPAQPVFADEGAANHMRIAERHGATGINVFVYGRDGFETPRLSVPARQTRQAGEVVARRHGLDPARCVFVRQSDAALEAGAFHNDVVAVANETVVFAHEQAFADPAGAEDAVRRAADGLCAPRFVTVSANDLPLSDAISSYLFNSQLVRAPGDNAHTLIAPMEAAENPRSKAVCDALSAGGGPIGAVDFVDVRQSMRNGGGPACLRLRVVLTPDERAGVHPGLWMTDALATRLSAWARARYRDRLSPDDLGDPALLIEARRALDDLTEILGLGPRFYDFQRAGA